MSSVSNRRPIFVIGVCFLVVFLDSLVGLGQAFQSTQSTTAPTMPTFDRCSRRGRVRRSRRQRGSLTAINHNPRVDIIPSSTFTMLQATTSQSQSPGNKKTTTQQQLPKMPPKKALVQGTSRSSQKLRAVYLKHERDFFRQSARLEAMDSYVLVSTLTASMSFGALLGFQPAVEAVVASSTAAVSSTPTTVAATATIPALTKVITAMSSSIPYVKVWLYQAIGSAIPVVAGFSAILGLYATIMFSLTILYAKSALGAERDLEYEKFLKRTVRPRVHGARCFTLSLSLFMVEAFLVMIERTYHRPWFLSVFISGAVALFYLYRDWRLIFRMVEYIYKD